MSGVLSGNAWMTASATLLRLRDRPPLLRPRFASWLWERDITNVEAAEAVGCHPLTVGRICKPFGDPDRRMPEPPVMERIVELTRGDVTPNDFYPPRSRPAPDVADGPEVA